MNGLSALAGYKSQSTREFAQTCKGRIDIHSCLTKLADADIVRPVLAVKCKYFAGFAALIMSLAYCAGSMRRIAPLGSSVARYSKPSGPCFTSRIR
jgi:hypothetical protein